MTDCFNVRNPTEIKTKETCIYISTSTMQHIKTEGNVPTQANGVVPFIRDV